MKYLVHYPIYFDCNLHCDYCFHKEYFQTYMKIPKTRFNISHWNKFRDTHLVDAEEIIMNMYGGETFLETNTNIITHFIKYSKNEKLDLLTNGLVDMENYKKLVPFVDRVNRIGFTFHRKTINNVPSLIKTYEDNLTFMRDKGFAVYVKEILFPEFRYEILEDRKKWKEKGFEVKIQDFRQDGNKHSNERFDQIPLDAIIIDQEYLHHGNICSCMKGYKNIIIRQGWDESSHGDIIACWHDVKELGNIIDNSYDPNYEIIRDYNLGKIVVKVDANKDLRKYNETLIGNSRRGEIKFIR